jgi:hypothetical protein
MAGRICELQTYEIVLLEIQKTTQKKLDTKNPYEAYS